MKLGGRGPAKDLRYYNKLCLWQTRKHSTGASWFPKMHSLLPLGIALIKTHPGLLLPPHSAWQIGRVLVRLAMIGSFSKKPSYFEGINPQYTSPNTVWRFYIQILILSWNQPTIQLPFVATLLVVFAEKPWKCVLNTVTWCSLFLSVNLESSCLDILQHRTIRCLYMLLHRWLLIF